MVCKTEVSELKCWVYYTQGTRELIFVLPCTPVKDVFEYVEKHSKLQTFVLYFSVGSIKWINLCEMMNKTMAEVGVDFPSDRETKSFIIVAEHGQPPNMDLYLTYNSLSSDDDYINLKSHTKPKTNYVGLVNQAMTCYLNSLLQALYMTPEFRNALYNWEYVDGLEKDETKSIPYQLQKLFLNLQTSTKSAVETTSLTKSFGWNSNEAWQQQDIQELCRVMFDALELKFKNTEQADLINRLYEGKMIDYVRCLECGTEKSREDTFLDIPLPVRPFGSNVAYNSVEEAMRAFVQYETLDGTNQYHCEKCNKKCDAQKGLKFTKFPYLLTLHLKRFDFDYESFHRIKLNDKVTFPDILNLNSFIESPINQESPSGEEDAGLSVKCDDSSTTDSGTLDEDCLPCDNSFSNTNISTNPDQDDDEGIDMNNGPSTSNCNTYNNENEKHNSSAMRRGPYQYELFSIMIHSGSASGGHYYAYIKDFRTQEWWCFNDQSVSQITDDDIQKTYGGGQTRPYYSGVYSSSTNAYMLMYRQIDPARNALPMQAQDFPQHIQELLQKMKESEDNDKKNREKEISCVITKVYCHHPTDGYLLVNKLCLIMTETLAEATEEAYKEFDFKLTVNLDQCRLVSYDRNKDLIECSYEGREQETIASIWPNQSHFELLLDIRKKDQEFEIYLPGGITTKVFIIDVFKNEVIDGPINVRGLLSQTVKDYKIVLGKIINMDSKQMKLVLREHNVEIKFLDEDDLELQLAGFIYANQVFVSTAFDTEINKPFNESIMYKIIKSFESLISLKVELPYVNKELLENFAIPSLDDKYEEKEEPFSNGPSKSNAVRIRDYRNAIVKCTEILKDVKNDFYERDNYRTSLVSQFRDTEDWCTPEQSNSEDSSLSDSDKTLVGGAPEDDDFPLPYGVISENRRFELSDYIDIQNSDSDDESEYYFKVMPRTNSTQKLLRILVNKKMRLGTLKKDLEPYVGVRAAHFKVYRHFGDTKSECTCAMEKLDSYNDGDRLNLMLWRTLQNGEIKVKVYRLHIDSFTQPYHLLCETILSKDMTVAYAKKKILAEIKKKYDIDIPYEKCRLRKKCHMQASKVFLDKQKFEDLSLFITHEMIIQELPDKETVVDSNQTVIFVRRWSPAEMKLGQFQEIVLDEKSIEELRKKLASISDIPEECIDIAKGEDVFPCDISVLKVQNEHQWNESTTSNIHLDSKDGDVFLYRDSREKPKNLSADEKKEIINREVLQFLPLFQGRRYIKRKERALKIQFDTK